MLQAKDRSERSLRGGAAGSTNAEVRPATRACSWIDGLLAFACAAVPVALHVAWARLDHSRPINDDAELYLTSACLFRELGDAPMGALAACESPYPPLVPLVAALHHGLVGQPSLSTAVISLWPFYALLGAALFLGIRRESGRAAGVAAAALGPVLVMETSIRGAFFTEVPMAALGITSVVLLSWSRGLARPGPSAALGATLSLGLLTKWSFAFFMGPPMALAVAIALWRASKRRGLAIATILAAGTAVVGLVLHITGPWRWGGTTALVAIVILVLGCGSVARWRPAWLAAGGLRRWLGLGACGAVASCVAVPWYARHTATLQELYAGNMSHQFDGDPLALSEAWSFYPGVTLVWVQTPLLLLAGVGAVRVLLGRRESAAVWALLAIVSGTVVLSLLPSRSGRYLIPALVLLAPVIIAGIRGIPRVSTPVFALLAAFGLFFQIAWMIPGVGRYLDRQEWFYGFSCNDPAGMQRLHAQLSPPRWRVRWMARGPQRCGLPIRELGRLMAEAVADEDRFLLVTAGVVEFVALDAKVAISTARSARHARAIETTLDRPGDLRQIVRRQCGGHGAGGWPAGLVVVSQRGCFRPPHSPPCPAEAGTVLDSSGFELVGTASHPCHRRVQYQVWTPRHGRGDCAF